MFLKKQIDLMRTGLDLHLVTCIHKVLLLCSSTGSWTKLT